MLLEISFSSLGLNTSSNDSLTNFMIFDSEEEIEADLERKRGGIINYLLKGYTRNEIIDWIFGKDPRPKYAKWSTNESLGDVLKPKSKEEIENDLGQKFDEITTYLMDYDDNQFDDYLYTYEFVEEHKSIILNLLEDNEKTIEEIAMILVHGKNTGDWWDDSDFLDDYES